MSRTCFYQWFDFYKTTTKIKQKTTKKTKRFFSFYDWATGGADESGASSVIIKIWRSVSALVSVDFTTHSKESDWVWHFMSARQNHSTNAKTSFNLANGVLKWRWNDRSSQDINQFITIHIYRILFLFFFFKAYTLNLWEQCYSTQTTVTWLHTKAQTRINITNELWRLL